MTSQHWENGRWEGDLSEEEEEAGGSSFSCSQRPLEAEPPLVGWVKEGEGENVGQHERGLK